MTNREMNILKNTKLPVTYCKETYALYGEKLWLLDFAFIMQQLNRMGFTSHDDQYWQGMQHYEERFDIWKCK